MLLYTGMGRFLLPLLSPVSLTLCLFIYLSTFTFGSCVCRYIHRVILSLHVRLRVCVYVFVYLSVCVCAYVCVSVCSVYLSMGRLRVCVYVLVHLG